MRQDSFIELIKSMIKDSGGSVDKINLEEFIEVANDSFLSPWNLWLGVNIQKSPLDLMILQEIMFEKRPDTVIECGTAYGGSAYYMAHLMDLMSINGKIITIDKQEDPPDDPNSKKELVKIGRKTTLMDVSLHKTQIRPKHPKIKYIHSDCLTAKLPKLGNKTMVVLDCDHTAGHVYKELEKFAPMVTIGQYIIVEDTVVHDKIKGPVAAVKKFLGTNKNFVTDPSREKFQLSSNHGGYLLRVS